MGVFEERISQPSMHWQPPTERYTSDAYEPSADASPGVPSQSPNVSPSPPPPSCRSCSPDRCAGCGGHILDKYYLQAVERRWHAPCLRCCECKVTLDTEMKCYSRDGNIFCKNDYFRIYAAKRCARCHTNINASELVMRARELVFHIRCFSCALCNTPLNKGDTFGIRESTVYCRLHYETIPEYMSPTGLSQGSICTGSYISGPPFLHYSTPDSRIEPLSLDQGQKSPFYNGGVTAPVRQKGRPRKKKPKDLDVMPTNLDLSPEYMDLGFRSGGGGLGGSSRTKRMRTSFKHHQLRTMKSYFAVNHNPDAKDLKQLSQKTGLPKRVLQVWFQNARAKWRRMVTKQEGKMGAEKYSPDRVSDIDSNTGGSYARGSGIPSSVHSMSVTHSPDYSVMGGPNSPNSMECM